MPKGHVPIDIICEFLGNVSFNKNEESDVATAEHLASGWYPTLRDLVQTCKGAITYKKGLKDFHKVIQNIHTSTFYEKYLPTKEEVEASKAKDIAEYLWADRI